MGVSADTVQQMQGAGFTGQEIGDWSMNQRKSMSQAGFSNEEIDADFGIKAPDMAGVQAHVTTNVNRQKAEDTAAVAAQAASDAAKKTAPPAGEYNTPGNAPDQIPTGVSEDIGNGVAVEAKTWASMSPGERAFEAINIGLDGSLAALFAKHQLPKELPADAGLAYKILSGIATVTADAPAYIGGGIAGGIAGAETGPGAVVTAAMGAFAVPAMIRKSLVDNITKGSIKSTGDFAERTVGIAYEGGKGALVGALTATTGVEAKAAMDLAGAAPWLATTGKTAAELGTMTLASAALEKELPSVESLSTNAIMVGLFHVAGAAFSGKTPPQQQRIVDKVRQTYAATEIKPEDLFAAARQDPVLMGDLLSDTHALPAAVRGRIDPTYTQALVSNLPEPTKTAPDLSHLPELPPDLHEPVLRAADHANAARDEAQQWLDLAKEQAKEGAIDPVVIAKANETTRWVGEWKTRIAEIERDQRLANENFNLEKPAEVPGAAGQAGTATIKSGEAIAITPSIKAVGRTDQEPGEHPDFQVVAKNAKGETIGYSVLTNEGGGVVTPGYVSVQDRYTRQGVATALYKYLAQQGFRVKVSDTLTELGQKFRDATGDIGKEDAGKSAAFLRAVRDEEYGKSLDFTTPHAPVGDLSKIPNALPMEGETGEKASSLQRAREELQAGSSRPVEITIGPRGPVVTDGRHLLAAARELGIQNLPVRVVGGTLDDAFPNRQAPQAGAGGVGGNAPPPTPPAAAAPPPGPSRDPWGAVGARINFDGKDPKTPYSWDSFYYKTVDDLDPIHVDVKAMAGDIGLKASDLLNTENAYTLMRLTRGTFGRADWQLEKATYDFNTFADNGPGLKQVFAPVAKDMRGWAEYAVSKRALELANRGIETGVPLADATEVVRTGAAEFEGVNREAVAYQNRVSQQLVDSGIISQDLHDQMKVMNEQYTPFNRVIDGEGGGVGFGGNVYSPIKEIKGSERQIVNPLESMVKNTYVFTALSERNMAARAYLDLARSTGHPEDWIEKVPPKAVPITVSDAEMTKFLTDNGIAGVPSELLQVFRSLREPLGDNQMAVFEDGKRTVYELQNPLTAEAFKGADRQTAGLLLQLLSVPAATLRAGATTFSIDFAGRNLIRDQTAAAVYGGGIPVFDGLRGLYHIATTSEQYGYMTKGGGLNAAMVSLDRDYFRESLGRLDLLDNETGLMSRAWNVVKTPYHLAQVMSEVLDNASRVGAGLREDTGLPGRENSMGMGYAGRDTTLDFAKKGADNTVRALNMISAFFSANVNGMDKMVRSFKDNPVGTTMRTLAYVTLPSVLLYEANKDDPRMTNGAIEQWQKDLFYIVLTKEHIIRIPKDFQLGVIFGSGAEHMLQVMDEYSKNHDTADIDTRVLGHYAGQVAGQVMPPIMPNAIVPGLEQVTNHSFLTGNKLIPDQLERLAPEYRYTDYTTQTSRQIGAFLGAFPGMGPTGFMPKFVKELAAPMIVDNYVREWTGSAGTYAMQAADYALRKAGAVPDPVMPARTLADIPFVKAFVVRYPSAQAQVIQDFYDQQAEHKMKYDTVMMLAQSGDKIGLMKELGYKSGDTMDGPTSQAMNQAMSDMAKFDGIQQTLSAQMKMVHMIVKNPDWNADEKRQMIDSTYGQMITTAHYGTELFKQVDKALAPNVAKTATP